MFSPFEMSQIPNYIINPSIHHTRLTIKHKLYATLKAHYSILNYDKDFLCFNDTESSIYRSVICSYPEKQVLCFSPTKSVPYNSFIQSDKTCISEIVEGIMVNLFFDTRIQSWEIATKSAVGCKYGQKYNNNELTIYDMFIKALAGNSEKTLNDNPIISMLPKWCSFSFVISMQAEPQLTLVAVYNIQKLNILMLPSSLYKNWKVFEDVQDIILFPKEYNHIDKNTTKKGYMLVNYETGQRSKWINPDYIIKKKLSKIKPATQYLYLCLRRVSKVYDYLTYFSKQKRDFLLLEKQYEDYIDKVHQYYLEHFVKKNINWDDIPEKFKNTIYKIHYTIFLKGLSQNMHIVITKNIIKDWLNKKNPNEVATILTFNHSSPKRP
jgi:hypothetical protein